MRYHVGIVKALLLTLVRTNGHEHVLKRWGGTTEDALRAIEADPREVFVLSDECDRQEADGSCAGHPD